MHKSRVYAVLIDTPAPEAEQAATFWSAALGARARPVPGEEQFTVLHQAMPGLVTAVQAVDDAPRFHLDIETDDVEAETKRLLALGAQLVVRGRRTDKRPRPTETVSADQAHSANMPE